MTEPYATDGVTSSGAAEAGDDDGTAEQRDADRARQREVARRVPLALALTTVTLGVAGFIAGTAIATVKNHSPYLTTEELRAELDELRAEQNGSEAIGVDSRPPQADTYDPGSLFLSAVIDDNPVWIATRNRGDEVCMYVDFDISGANIDSCVAVTPPVTAMGIASNDPRLTDPADTGIYTLTLYDGALPYIEFTPR